MRDGDGAGNQRQNQRAAALGWWQHAAVKIMPPQRKASELTSCFDTIDERSKRLRDLTLSAECQDRRLKLAASFASASRTSGIETEVRGRLAARREMTFS